MAANVEEMKALRKKLKKETNADAIVGILKSLSKYENVTEEMLKQTRVGKTVGKLRKHEDKEVVNLSKALVNKWKESVSSTKKSKSSPESSATPKSSQDDEKKVLKRERDAVPEESPQTTAPKKSRAPPPKDGDRARLRDLMAKSLATEDDSNTMDLAETIEEELYSLFNAVDKAYKNKFRSITFNLKKNAELRTSVIRGQITPKDLCQMSPEDMADETLKNERAALRHNSTEAAKARVPNQTSTDMFKCGKCGKRETSYYQMQTRSADEPMTTFHTCQACGARWKS
eukprot:TRINITY_DN14847_c0_g1_i1.p1 TRINITY_DN14847_c0_g1~~TRINITY_DN14847_c0_g1_i1.p1  ORF type:complete len:287 (-),score=82.44 TRINITY_DN14847_c0_g1_i1:142-1002(-)